MGGLAVRRAGTAGLAVQVAGSTAGRQYDWQAVRSYGSFSFTPHPLHPFPLACDWQLRQRTRRATSFPTLLPRAGAAALTRGDTEGHPTQSSQAASAWAPASVDPSSASQLQLLVEEEDEEAEQQVTRCSLVVPAGMEGEADGRGIATRSSGR